MTNRIIETIERVPGSGRCPGTGAASAAPSTPTRRSRTAASTWWRSGLRQRHAITAPAFGARTNNGGELEAQVRKGERASLIVFWKELEGEVENKETGKRERKKTLFARASSVFNADQVDGWTPPAAPERNLVQALDQAEAFTAATGADVRHGGERAYYRRSTDYVQMPDRERFTGSETSTPTETYYATLLHELTHWTGHESRLDRELSSRFGTEAYAVEELVAELGAAFLCADLSITNTPRPDHAAYIANWLEVLKRDKRAIFTAARKAAQASDFLASLQPKTAR